MELCFRNYVHGFIKRASTRLSKFPEFYYNNRWFHLARKVRRRETRPPFSPFLPKGW